MPQLGVVYKSLSHMSAEHIGLSSLTALCCPHTPACISCNHNAHRIACVCLCWGEQGTSRAEARPTGRSWGSWGARMGLKLPSRSHFVVDRDQWKQSRSSACLTSLSEDSQLTFSWNDKNSHSTKSPMAIYSLFLFCVDFWQVHCQCILRVLWPG